LTHYPGFGGAHVIRVGGEGGAVAFQCPFQVAGVGERVAQVVVDVTTIAVSSSVEFRPDPLSARTPEVGHHV
jgi:hypothetical protein